VIRLERRLVVRVGDEPARVVLQEVGEHPALAVGRTVLRDDDRLVDVGVQAVEQPAERVEAAPGRPDHDDLVHVTRSS
jgi:hypothetical protein